MNKLFEELLNKLIKEEVITEDNKSVFLENFEKKFKTVKEEIYADAIKKAEEITDEDHTKKLEEVTEFLDKDHTKKLEEIAELIDEDHTEKLEEVVSFIREEETDKIVEKLSKYIESNLEDYIPEQKLVDEAKLERFKKTFEEAKQILCINDEFINDEVAEAMKEAKDKIDSQEDELNILTEQRNDIKEKFLKLESRQVINRKTKNVSPKLKAYLETRFLGSSIEDIEEQFDEAIDAFNEDEDVEREKLLKEQDLNNKPRIRKEDKSQDKPTLQMEQYIKTYKRFNHNYSE